MNATSLASMSAGELAALAHSRVQTIVSLTHQLEWFRRQLFGQKSELRPRAEPAQMHLGEALPIPDEPLEKVKIKT